MAFDTSTAKPFDSGGFNPQTSRTYGWKDIIQNQSFWQNLDGSQKTRDEQIKTLNDSDSDFSKLPLQYKNEVIDSYKGKVKPYDMISTNQGGKEPTSWTSDIPQMIGGIIGGFADKTVPGRILKAGVFGGGGEAGKQLYQHATGSKDAPQTSMEANDRIAEAMLAQGGGQAVGEGMTRVGAKLIPKIKPEYLEKGLEEPTATLKSYMAPYEKPQGLIEYLDYRKKKNLFLH
jgi:hypothetical protein